MDIRIPFLNAFKLRITGNVTSGTHTETADMNVVRNLIVNFVRRGRIFQAHGIDMQGRIVILNLGTLPSGTYGVELVGYYNGEPWRFFQKDVFEIVRQNSDATPAGSGDVPTYDVTFELNFGGESVSAEYVDAAIAAHDADEQAHPDLREALQTLETELRQEIAEAGEVNDVQIDGHSILDPETKVANIEITASVVEDDTPGDPTATATMQDGNINIEFEHVKGERGNGIASITEQVSDQDGGINTHTITDDDGQTHIIHTRNGQTGRPGADRQPVESGDVIIAHSMGCSEEKVMDQKTVSDGLVLIDGIDERWDWKEGKRMHINTPSVLQNDSAFQTSYPLAVEKGDIVEVVTAGDGSHPFTVIAYLETEDATTWVKKAVQSDVSSTATNTYTWVADIAGYVVVCGVIAGMSAQVTKANRLVRLDEFKELETTVKEKVITELNPETIAGEYYAASGVAVPNNNYKRTDYIDLTQYAGYKVRIALPDDYVTDSACHVLKDASGNVVQSVSNASIVANEGRTYDMPVIKDGYSIGFSWRVGKTISIYIANADVKDVMDDIEEVDALSDEVAGIEYELEAVSEIGIPVRQGSSVNYTEEVSIPAGVEYSLECLPTEYVDANGFNLRVTYSDESVSQTLSFKPGSTITRTEEKDVVSFSFIRTSSGIIGTGTVEAVLQLNNSIKGRIEKLERSSSDSLMMFVSTTGDDANDGSTPNKAKATINAALEGGAEIVMLDGGTYFMDIDLSKSTRGRVSIKGVSGKNVVIKGKDSTICDDGSEELVDGYENVYRVPVTYPHMPSRWLYFDGLNDEETLISAAERHPSQKGKFYRCESTRIIPCTAQTLEAALAEIEESSAYKWYFDNGYLYFNRYAPTQEYPLMDSGSGNGFIKGNSSVYTPIDLEISNVEFRYEMLNVENLNSVHLSSVSAKYVRGNGAILYNRTLNAVFENCEAARACTGSYGDGFNAHAADSEAGSRGTYAQLINCWSHDNNDDGYSDHEFSETLIIGGLFEYNGKAGVTPSYGSHLNGHNIISRKNYCGYYYIGKEIDGGNGGQMALHNCISDSNTMGGNRAGYYIDYGNDAILYNCIAMNETTGFKCSSSQMKLIDCKVYNCATPREGSTITIVNGAPLS